MTYNQYLSNKHAKLMNEYRKAKMDYRNEVIDEDQFHVICMRLLREGLEQFEHFIWNYKDTTNEENDLSTSTPIS